MAADNIKVVVNVEPLLKTINSLKELKKPINQSIERLAMAAYNQAIALVNQKLKSDREKGIYLKNLHFEKNSTGGFNTYLIILNEEALFIEDGAPDQDMRKTHLKNRDYVRIPFKHSDKVPAGEKSKQSDIVREIKTAMKENKIPLTKAIVDKNGNPVLSAPGQPRAAAMIKKINSAYKGSVSGQSILNNLNVYQTERINRAGNKTIDRTYLTFRTLSKNSSAKWIIPGKPGIKIFDEVYKWIETSYQKFMDEQLKNLELIIK